MYLGSLRSASVDLSELGLLLVVHDKDAELGGSAKSCPLPLRMVQQLSVDIFPEFGDGIAAKGGASVSTEGETSLGTLLNGLPGVVNLVLQRNIRSTSLAERVRTHHNEVPLANEAFAGLVTPMEAISLPSSNHRRY